MKKFLKLVLLGILAITAFSYSQDIPDGVKNIMKKLQNDPSIEFGFEFAKKYRFIEKDTEFKDWLVGLPIEIYKLNRVALDKANDYTKIRNVIETSNTWLIPVRVGEKYIYKVKLLFEDGNYKAYGCGEGVIGFNMWDKVREKYPEETGVQPILIGMKHKFLFFPNEKNDKNMFYVRNSKCNDEISLMTSSSLDNLDENKKIIKLWKKILDRNKDKRIKFYERHPDIFEDISGGSK